MKQIMLVAVLVFSLGSFANADGVTLVNPSGTARSVSEEDANIEKNLRDTAESALNEHSKNPTLDTADKVVNAINSYLTAKDGMFVAFAPPTAIKGGKLPADIFAEKLVTIKADKDDLLKKQKLSDYVKKFDEEDAELKKNETIVNPESLKLLETYLSEIRRTGVASDSTISQRQKLLNDHKTFASKQIEYFNNVFVPGVKAVKEVQELLDREGRMPTPGEQKLCREWDDKIIAGANKGLLPEVSSQEYTNLKDSMGKTIESIHHKQTSSQQGLETLLRESEVVDSSSTFDQLSSFKSRLEKAKSGLTEEAVLNRINAALARIDSHLEAAENYNRVWSELEKKIDAAGKRRLVGFYRTALEAAEVHLRKHVADLNKVRKLFEKAELADSVMCQSLLDYLDTLTEANKADRAWKTSMTRAWSGLDQISTANNVKKVCRQQMALLGPTGSSESASPAKPKSKPLVEAPAPHVDRKINVPTSGGFFPPQFMEKEGKFHLGRSGFMVIPNGHKSSVPHGSTHDDTRAWSEDDLGGGK